MSNARYPSSLRHAPLFLALFALVSAAAPATAGPVRYRVTDLGLFEPSAINNHGQVAGTRQDLFFPTAALYDGGVLRTVETPGDGQDSSAHDINDAGQVVGRSNEGRGFLYEGGTVRDLGTLDDHPFSGAAAINNAGQVVGSSESPDGSRAFLYDGGRMRALGTLGGDSSFAYDINNQGQVVGRANTEDLIPGEFPFQSSHAFLYDAGVMRDLGTIPGTGLDGSVALDINDRGQVAGNGYFSLGGDSPTSRAFVYEDGVLRDLGTTPDVPYGYSSAASINNAGQVVGLYGDADENGFEHAFLYENGQVLDLNDLISTDSGWDLREATDINDLGWIVGIGSRGGFLLTPIDDGPGPSPNPIPLPPAVWTGLGVLAGVVLGTNAVARRSRLATGPCSNGG